MCVHNQLYIKFYKKLKENVLEVPLESLITLFICKYLGNKTTIQIYFVQQDVETILNNNFFVNINELNNYVYHYLNEAALCEMPYICTDNNTIIAGLCAVNRQIIKNTNTNIDLLGFKNACLKAPNETSIWTKFCEIDMIYTTNNIYNYNETFDDDVIHIPKDIIRLENHMCEPVRIHNIYKIAQEQNKQITCLTHKEDLNISHKYVEGPFMTIADIILWPQLHLILNKIYNDQLPNEIPLIYEWYQDLFNKHSEIKNAINLIEMKSKQNDNNIIVSFVKPVFKLESLYKSDPKRRQYKSYTKQNDIDNSLTIVNKLPFEIKSSNTKPFGFEIEFDWNTIPIEANPIGGALPSTRANRKCQQLENLAKSVIKLAKSNDVIVDFCSGSGHLGILLAVKLPKCLIILLENKEESLTRAKIRVEQLKLNNVKLLQCNLDYFNADFNIGVSLHACGVATDLVIQHCVRKNAAFVCCPCCYGGVHNCHHLTYPRSIIFKESDLTLKDYLVLGHSADQTHGDEHLKSKQGNLCMDIIDTDRMLQAVEFDYTVMLGKLEPTSCTPKNNLLVGWPENKFRSFSR